MNEGKNPADRSKLGKAKRHILTDKKAIPLSTVITSASIHDIKVVTNVIDNSVVRQPSLSYFRKDKRRKYYLGHLCLDRKHIILNQSNKK
jgi:hypothetical protein